MENIFVNYCERRITLFKILFAIFTGMSGGMLYVAGATSDMKVFWILAGVFIIFAIVCHERELVWQSCYGMFSVEDGNPDVIEQLQDLKSAIIEMDRRIITITEDMLDDMEKKGFDVSELREEFIKMREKNKEEKKEDTSNNNTSDTDKHDKPPIDNKK